MSLLRKDWGPSTPAQMSATLWGMRRSPSAARIAGAFLVTVVIMLAVPSVAHLFLGGPNEIPIALGTASLLATVVAAAAGVAFLVWRPPSGWTTVLAVIITAATMTLLPSAVANGWWQVVVVYLAFFGVYVAIVLALAAAAAVLHGRNGLRFRSAVGDPQLG